MCAPTVRGQVRRRHLPWATVGWAVLLLSAFLPYQDTIALCPFLRLTGWPCMFCGLTRSFAAFSKGAWGWAWRNAPLAALVYAGVWGLAVGHTWALIRGRLCYPGPRLASRRAPLYTAYGIGGLLLLNWIYRIWLGLS